MIAKLLAALARWLRALADRADGGTLIATVTRAQNELPRLRELVERLQGAVARAERERDDALTVGDAMAAKLRAAAAGGRTVRGQDAKALPYGTVLVRTDPLGPGDVVVRVYAGWWAPTDRERAQLDPNLTFRVLHEPANPAHPLEGDEAAWAPSGPPTHLLDGLGENADLWEPVAGEVDLWRCLTAPVLKRTRAQITAEFGAARDVWIAPTDAPAPVGAR